MRKYAIIRLGKDSVPEIEKLDNFHSSPKDFFNLTISCTQVPNEITDGDYCLLYLGSDNSKGVPTKWTQGIRALGKIIGKTGGPKYADKKEIEVEVKIILPESINKQELLAKASDSYYWFSQVPIVGISSYSNQTIQVIKDKETTQNIYALFYAINVIHPIFKELVEKHYPELAILFDYSPPSTTNLDGETPTPVFSLGWRDYPLDSVFVRKEQRSVSDIIKRIENKRIILNPDFQRDFIWSVKKQSRLIESCLMRIPLPVFYVAESKDGRIIVVDGLQRLTTFYRYLGNDFAIKITNEPQSAENDKNSYLGKRFDELSLTLQERLEDTQLTLYILDAKAPDRAKLDIFERVNSGEPLTRQQMRNCLFNGAATAWLKKAAESEAFLQATGRSIDTKSMRDREVINRFCAFQILGVDEYRSDMDDFLADALTKMNEFSSHELDDLFNVFLNSMDVNYRLFGKHAFRKSLGDLARSRWVDRTVINIALFDVCSVLFAYFDVNILEKYSEELRQIMSDLLAENDFFQAISYGTNGITQVRTRFRLMHKAISEVVH